jgi:hypothetical protein
MSLLETLDVKFVENPTAFPVTFAGSKVTVPVIAVFLVKIFMKM